MTREQPHRSTDTSSTTIYVLGRDAAANSTTRYDCDTCTRETRFACSAVHLDVERDREAERQREGEYYDVLAKEKARAAEGKTEKRERGAYGSIELYAPERDEGKQSTIEACTVETSHSNTGDM